MDLIEQLSHLLPILAPFELERMEKDEPKQEVHLYLRVNKEHLPPDHTLHSYYEREWEHLKLFQYRCFIHCQIPIYKEKKSGKFTKAEISFSRDHARFTLLYEAEVMRLMKINHSFTAVATSLGINIQRVESIYHHYTQNLEEDIIGQTPVNIAFDETSTRKGHDYITTFFDLDTRKIIGIYDGKSAQCVEQFKQDHPYPQALRNISIDMSPAFISGAKACFPQARITFDKWHVIKLIYKHLDKLEKTSEAFKKYISWLMEETTAFYKQNKEQEMKAQLQFIADFAQQMLKDNPITKTILAHFEGITNYALSQINNGVLEGINSKIQTLKRIARGFRYKSTFKKMIRFAFDQDHYQVIS